MKTLEIQDAYEKRILNLLNEQIDAEFFEPITRQSDLFNCGITSVLFVKIAVALEEKFDIIFEEDKLFLNAFESMGEFIDYVISLLPDEMKIEADA